MKAITNWKAAAGLERAMREITVVTGGDEEHADLVGEKQTTG